MSDKWFRSFAINFQAMDCASTDQADAHVRINGVNDWLIG
jgi:hypothetical protein